MTDKKNNDGDKTTLRSPATASSKVRPGDKNLGPHAARNAEKLSVKSNSDDRTMVRGVPPAAPRTAAPDANIGDLPPHPPPEPNKYIQTESLWVNPDIDANVSDASPTVGQLLGGRYRLEHKLGEGGMGVVYLASDQEVQGEKFAVKVLKPEIRGHPDSLALLREEVRTTRALRRDTIVAVYSLNSDRHYIFMLMEYLEGKTLDALFREEFARGMPFSRAWPLIQDLCDGLAYAHDHNVIHSDLKPSNVFITTAGRAKLLDFGIARAARTRVGRFDPASMGALTLPYASCEMLAGLNPDHSDDIYGLGCVIYEMLCGKHPFGSKSADEAKASGAAVPRVPALTEGQNAALKKALAFDRDKRTSAVEELLEGLDPTVAPPLPPNITSRSYGFWIGAGCLAIFALALSGWYFFLERPKSAPPTPATTVASYDQLVTPMRSLLGKARSLEVDPDDPSMVRGTQQLAAAEGKFAAGSTAEAVELLGAAAESLDRAIRSGRRVAHVGSTPDEVAVATTICRQLGQACTSSDFTDEAPRTPLLSPFELDDTEVTNREFAEFADDTHYVTGAEREGGVYVPKGAAATFRAGESWKTLRNSLGPDVDPADYPVRGIDFNAAHDYCAWRNRRLPTEDEWEFVARGTDHRLFAWGNEPRRFEPGAVNRLLPASGQPATGRFGARGLGDGLLEWVDGGTATNRILRGASWLDSNPIAERLANRRILGPTHALLDTGIRCAQSVERWPDSKSGEVP